MSLLEYIFLSDFRAMLPHPRRELVEHEIDVRELWYGFDDEIEQSETCLGLYGQKVCIETV
jgi:hypothetical protein